LPVKQKKQIKTEKQIVNFWILVLLLAIIIGVVRWSIGMPNEKIIGQLIVVSVSASLLSLIIISILFSKQILTKII
jgi:membrane protein YdbS with pleckstrin-like domain